MDLWYVAAWVVIVSFVATVIFLLLAVAGKFPNAREEYLKPLIGVFLIELAGAFLLFFTSGPSEVTVRGDPQPNQAYAFDLDGSPVDLSIYREDNEKVLITYPALQRPLYKGVARTLEREDQRLLVTSTSPEEAGKVFLGYVSESTDRLVMLTVTPAIALAIGNHYSERIENDQRRNPKTACRFLAITIRRGSSDEMDEKREAAQTLFHIRDHCQEIGEEDVVIEAIREYRPEPQRSKELGDVYMGFASANVDNRARYHIYALAYYLSFLAAENSHQLDQVKRNVRDLLGSLRRNDRLESYVRGIGSALEATDFSRFKEWSVDLEQIASSILEE